MEQGPRLRAELGDFAVRLARLAVMAGGGGALTIGHPAQRLYREALLYSLMAQTDAIVGQAFEEVFG
jgi:alkylation response protein AidB-like acyl-CoA dehydrogenase